MAIKDCPVVVFCDNLDAHCWDEVLDECTRAKVLVVFVVPPGCIDAMQPIDAGIGRCIRIYHIGQVLDAWRMVNENLEKWESGFTASERRVLMANLLVEAATKVLQQDDSLRVGCFERTGCFLLYVKPDKEPRCKSEAPRLEATVLNPNCSSS